jgi:hypothetical protein
MCISSVPRVGFSGCGVDFTFSCFYVPQMFVDFWLSVYKQGSGFANETACPSPGEIV